MVSFQSTRPRGARRGGGRVAAHGGVSIHAPARGATADRAAACRYFARFNPRAREGRDYGIRLHLRVNDLFQSTRPRGARQTTQLSASLGAGFNPRAREGRDEPSRA